ARQPSQGTSQLAAESTRLLRLRPLVQPSELLSNNLIQRPNIGNFPGHQPTVADEELPAYRASGSRDRRFDSRTCHANGRSGFSFGRRPRQQVSGEGAPIGNLKVLE